VTGLRDFQRSRVYDAEHLVHRIFDRSGQFPVIEVAGSRLTLPIERRFGSIDAVQRYSDQLLALDQIRQRWNRAAVPVVVRERAGAAQAHYQRVGSVMAVPGHRSGSAWAMRELVILHELAHHLAPDVEVAHGGTFVERMIALVDEIIGPEAGFLLRVTMADVGVRSS
jgi:putative metallohydrolase (TIGR04338 family)